MFESDDLDVDEDFLGEIFGDLSGCNVTNQQLPEPSNVTTNKRPQSACSRDKTGEKNYLNRSLQNNHKGSKRKFPGPAGLLPERRNFSTADIVNDSTCNNDETFILQGSQASQSSLEDEPWQKLLADLGTFPPGKDVLDCLNIASIKRKAAARLLVGHKVPFLAAILHDIDCSSPDPYLTLRDHTGEINGTLHREVWQQFGGDLQTGCVLVLRNLGVLSIGVNPRRHYLNITANNLATIYNVQQGNVCTHDVRSMTSEDFVNSVQEWLSNIKSPQALPNSPILNRSLLCGLSPCSSRNISTPGLFSSEISPALNSSYKTGISGKTIPNKGLSNNERHVNNFTKENRSAVSSISVNKGQLNMQKRQAGYSNMGNKSQIPKNGRIVPRAPLANSSNRIPNESIVKTDNVDKNSRQKFITEYNATANGSGSQDVFNMDLTLEDFNTEDFGDFFKTDNGSCHHNELPKKASETFQPKKPRTENRNENVQLTLSMESNASVHKTVFQNRNITMDHNDSLAFNETLEDDEKSIVDSVLDGIDADSLFAEYF